jgi:hypothetical protein
MHRRSQRSQQSVVATIRDIVEQYLKLAALKVLCTTSKKS